MPNEDEIFPYVRRIGEVFEGKYVINDNSEWLEESCSTPSKLESLLDRVERLILRGVMLLDNWESEKLRIYDKYGIKPYLL